MSFLNQALLFGLFAVSIPVIIHLLNRRRFRKVPWAAMRFIKVSVEQNQRRMKLEDVILLLLRCALITLLALAVARPVVEGLQGTLPGSKVAAAVILDTSASMATVEGDATRLAAARAAARKVVEGLPPGSPVAISTPFRPGEPTTDHGLARRRIDEAPQTSRHADLLTALGEAAQTLEGQAAAEKEIYLITDGHAEEWSAFAALEEKLRALAAATKLHLVLVGSPARSNLAVSRLVPSGALPTVGQPFRIDAEVANHGAAPAVDVAVRLLVDGQPAGEPWIIDEIRPGRRENATLYAALPAAGYHRVTVALAGDALTFDDRRTWVLRAVEEVRVLLVDGEPGAEPRESETFFLRHALAPVSEEGRASYPVKPEVVSVSELPGQDLGAFDAVVLANVSDVSLPMAELLEAYVANGGGLVVFPGENIRTEFYNTILHGKHGLLPAAFVSLEAGDQSATRALVPTETNPLGFDEAMLSAATFRRVCDLEALGKDERDRSRLALRYDDGSPALVESTHGLGKVFLFTSTADTAWNDFPVTPAFVPFAQRLLGAIVQHRDANLNLRAGDPLHHRVPAGLVGREATVYEVNDPESLGQLTRIEEKDGGALLRFGDTHRAGAYQAAIEGEAMPVLFAAAPSDRESSLELLEAEQLARLADSATIVRWGDGSGAAELGAGRKGAELWLPLLFAVIGIAAVEMALAQWFSRPK